jgi:hypothetical protein
MIEKANGGTMKFSKVLIFLALFIQFGFGSKNTRSTDIVNNASRTNIKDIQQYHKASDNNTSNRVYRSGLIYSDPRSDPNLKQVTSIPLEHGKSLLTAVDLSSEMPPVGNQSFQRYRSEERRVGKECTG